MSTVVCVENISKYYRLGMIGGQTLGEDLERWWAKVRGRPDPFLRIGQTIYGNHEDGYIWALKNVSFEIKEGQVVGIIGRNGAGKSTLLKILSRITAPTSGQIKLKGRIASLLEVGTGFHPELTGRENIYLNGAILGMTRTEIARKFDEIVAFSEVEKFIDTPVKRYSSGMHVRLAFAVAAHLDPEILLVDEVLAVGDAQFQRKCLGKMDEVSKQGRTVLFVSHNMGAVLRLVSTCILLEKGQVAQIGEPRQVVDAYLESGIAQGGEMTFADDESRFAQVRRVAIRNSRGEMVSVLDPAEDIRMEVDFIVRQPDIGRLNIAGVLSLVEDVPIFRFDSSASDAAPKKWMAGEYRLHVVFPGNTLNCGRYVLRVATVLDAKAHHNRLDYGDGLELELTEASEVGASGTPTLGYQQGKKQGLLIVPLTYSLDRIAQDGRLAE